MKLDRLVKLEQRLAKALDRRLRDPAGTPDTLELVPMILDHVEEHVVPTPGGGRTFPYDRVTIEIAVPPETAAAMRAVLDHPPGLEERVRARLREAGCDVPDRLRVVTRLAGKAPAAGEAPFRIEYHERRATRETAPRAVVPPRVRITVLAGAAGPKVHDLEHERIHLGRMRRVEDVARGSVRHNHVAFTDDGSDVNASVSRAHAHLDWDAVAAAWTVYDDGSAHGTRVLRAGRAVTVPPQGSRGVRLRDGDEIELGSARVRITLAPPAKDGAKGSQG